METSPPGLSSLFSASLGDMMTDATPKQQYDVAATEKKWREAWLVSDVHAWDPKASRADSYVIDTPPPTVSGVLHIGHIYSYTQTDLIARFERMSGKNVFYPMGFDDNGLPTERLVEKRRKIRAVDLSREEFIRICHEEVQEAEQDFRDLFRTIGLSIDWALEYQTISPQSRRISQHSVLDLFEKGHLYRQPQPTLWDPADRTALAQAEIEDKEKEGTMWTVSFDLVSGGTIEIATTRPELLAACGAVMIHPDHPRAQELVGQEVVTPLFGVPVRFVADEKVDPEKGTGLVMCCTFGDTTDIEWWRMHSLPLRVIVTREGKIGSLAGIGGADWPSRDLDGARRGRFRARRPDRQYGTPQDRRAADGRRSDQGRRGGDAHGAVRRALGLPARNPGDAAMVRARARQEGGADRQGPRDPLVPGLYAPALRDLDREPQMGLVYQPPALFRCAAALLVFEAAGRGGQDPAGPSGRSAGQSAGRSAARLCPRRSRARSRRDGYLGDQLGLARSSTPMAISAHLAADPDRYHKLFPADLRPQAHEIIRTWTFYTVLKSLIHEDSVPWHDVALSGWALAHDGSKQSKSKGNAVPPREILAKYGADVVRYWTATSRLGLDTVFSEDVLKIGKRLQTKLWNAARFLMLQLDGLDEQPTTPAAGCGVVGQGSSPSASSKWILSAARSRDRAHRHREIRDLRLRRCDGGGRALLLGRSLRQLPGTGEGPRLWRDRHAGRPALGAGDAVALP